MEDEALAEECHDVVDKEIIVEERQCEKGNIPKGGLWRHTSRGTLHLHGSLMGRTGDYLVCCRVITKTYEKLLDESSKAPEVTMRTISISS